VAGFCVSFADKTLTQTFEVHSSSVFNWQYARSATFITRRVKIYLFIQALDGHIWAWWGSYAYLYGSIVPVTCIVYTALQWLWVQLLASWLMRQDK